MVQGEIKLGVGSYCATPPFITPEVTVTVGKMTSISSNLTVIGGQAQHAPVKHPRAVSTFPFKERSHLDYFPCEGKGPVIIGSDVWIGKDVTIFDGLTIGDGAIIGACTVVTKNVPPYAVVVGNPGRIKKYRFTTSQIDALLRIRWWDFENLNDAVPDMKDIDEFIAKYDLGNNPDSQRN